MGELFGSNQKAVNTYSSSQPWAPQVPALETELGQAQNLYNNPQFWPSYYPNDTYAPMNSAEQNANALIYAQGTQGTPELNAANNLSSAISQGAYLNSNPTNSELQSFQGGSGLGQGGLEQYANGSMLSAGNPYMQNVINQTVANTLPSIQGSFAGGNRLDSGLATNAESQGVANAVGNLAYENFNQNEQNQINASNTLGQQALTGAQQQAQNYNTGLQQMDQNLFYAPQLDAQQMSDAQSAFGAGQNSQQNQQNQINANVAQWNYDTNEPWNVTGMYQGLINGNYGGLTQGSQPIQQNSTASTIAGIGGLAGIASLMGAGGLLGGLFGGGGAISGALPMGISGAGGYAVL